MLAHQGGWDEILLVLGPILVIVGLLSLAKKRVDKSSEPPADSADDGKGA
jgi:hypothetical protein